MADYQNLRSSSGRLSYRREVSDQDLAISPGLFSHLQPRHHRPSRIAVSRIPEPPDSPKKKRRKRRRRKEEPIFCIFTKLANPRDTGAFRFFRSVVSTHSTQHPKTEVLPVRNIHKRQGDEAEEGSGEDMPSVDFLRGGSNNRSTLHASSPLARPVPQHHDGRHNDGRHNSVASVTQTRTSRAGSIATIPEEKPVAAGNGISVSIHLAEPLLFLQGYDSNDTNTRNTAMLRGSLHLRIHKSAKIKAVSLRFKGTAITKWPEGIPPKKTEFEERDTLMSHTWPFFNAQFPMAEGGSGADHVRLNQEGSKGGSSSPYMNGSPTNSSLNVSPKADKRLSMQHVQSRSFEKSESSSKQTTSVAQKGYRLFHPGDYVYNFELPLDSRLPENIDVDLGSVKYELEATVERAGAFRANLLGTKEVTLIRAPTEGSLEQVEPIAISRNWEDQLHYDIVISGKSFPLGSRIPIAFKLTPLAKVQCHRVKVFVTENIEYFCSNKRVHRMEPTRKVLLYEKRADGTTNSTFPGSTQRVTAGGGVPFAQRDAAARGERVETQDPANLLGRLDADASVGPTEMEFAVQLPGCQQLHDKDRMNMLHFDTTYQNIQVHHWIKIVMRLSRPDSNEPNKRRHFEISIDSPFHILSCRANQANTALPAYSAPESGPGDSHTAACGCVGAPRRRISPNHLPTLNSLNATAEEPNGTNGASSSTDQLPMRPSLARPPTAHFANGMSNGHVQRPMHILRAPSFNPPAFEDEEPPPPLATPPPRYNDIASPTAGHGMADYFSRFNSVYNDEDEDESEDDRAVSRGRVNLPLTPGGRLNRSMDLGRRDRGYFGNVQR